MVWWHSWNSPPTQHSDIQHCTSEEATLASIPIGSNQFVDSEMQKHVQEWDKSFHEILELGHFQSSLLLLRQCMQLSKVNYFIRINYTNHSIMKWAQHFDASLRKCFEGLIGKPLHESQ